MTIFFLAHPGVSEMFFCLLILTYAVSVAHQQMMSSPGFGYRWTMLEGAHDLDVCNGQTCGPDKKPHSSCMPLTPNKRCVNFEMMELSREEIDNIVKGHNGIRNRVAKSFRTPAANMNLLYWDSDLQRMAEGFIAQCTGLPDKCDFICRHKPRIS